MHVYLNTRVSLFKSRLWPEAQVSELIDVSDAALPGLLERRGLRQLAGGYADDDPRSLEARIVAILLEETRILLRPLTGAARQFLLYWIGRFEVSNVKSLIRAKMAGESASATAARLLDLGYFTHLDADALMRAEDVAELMRRLERTTYAEIVRNARQAFEESHDPFILDATLDRAYYDGLIRRARAIEPEAGPGFGRLMADLIDRLNLVWLLRYRFNYGLPPAQVYYLLLTPGYRLVPSLLRTLVGHDDLAAVLAGLPEALARPLVGAAAIPEVSARLERVAMDHAGTLLDRDGHPLARALAYLILRESGLRDLRGILRGRRLGLPTGDIRLAAGV
ncbi:MAG: V-type ATPase subunit [Gallionellaceae bacterium]|nr:V-type ATPase subunit [Gallionellaceae bacterium]